jgi:hypothetical protein
MTTQNVAGNDFTKKLCRQKCCLAKKHFCVKMQYSQFDGKATNFGIKVSLKYAHVHYLLCCRTCCFNVHMYVCMYVHLAFLASYACIQFELPSWVKVGKKCLDTRIFDGNAHSILTFK